MQDVPDLSRDGSEDSGRGVEPPRIGNNLPLALTSFIGREREMAEANKLLGTDRLLTLAGSGGSGTTCLALAVASGLVERFEDGMWLVELAPLSDPELVPGRLPRSSGCARHRVPRSSRRLWTTLSPNAPSL
jgi:hypothetical protein